MSMGRQSYQSSAAAPAPDAAVITALLGPTNTGKTHFAMERLLAHRTGMIGFPLRLLARENYDRAVSAVGKNAVALITGEEKIVPPTARYFLCTVEAMPIDREVEFLAVDEVQLAADPERGHVFTDRLQRSRGLKETIFIGAETVRPIIRRLVPEAEIVTRPRFSRLTYAGPKKITRLPPRTAAVAFSATDVYALAEVIRRSRGGTAVILGALSPRTRNAQIAMFQAGEVEYLVATDAIGMGLNMDVDHVAFSSLGKFDGRVNRALRPAEIGQIAGRAGRHMNDGSFGTTAGAEAPSPEIIAAVEGHEFEPLKHVYWRNPELNFSNLPALIASLSQPPDRPGLIPAREAEDFRTLLGLSRDLSTSSLATSADRVALLWEVCQIPDFRKVMSDAHVRLVGRIYSGLCSENGRISTDWMSRQVARTDKTTGDIGTLVGRIADIRTWTYISHHSDWIDDPIHWQGRTRGIEDRLSDALHERLTERFVDRRTATLVKKMRGKEELTSNVLETGEVIVEGLDVGTLKGFSFVPSVAADAADARAMRNAAEAPIRKVIRARIAELKDVSRQDISLTGRGEFMWRGNIIGRLTIGSHVLAPNVDPILGQGVEPNDREQIRTCLLAWLRAHLDHALAPLSPGEAQNIGSHGRALLFQLGEALGCLPRNRLHAQINVLTKQDRKVLFAMGVRLGRESVFVPRLSNQKARRLTGLLRQNHVGAGAPENLPKSLLKGTPVLALGPSVSGEICEACGYRVARGWAIRADKLEALSFSARTLAAQGGREDGFAPTPALAQAAGCDLDTLPAILGILGYRFQKDEAGGKFTRKSRQKSKRRNVRKKETASATSPFAILKELTATR